MILAVQIEGEPADRRVRVIGDPGRFLLVAAGGGERDERSSDRHHDAVVCGAACRRERSRVRALLAGMGAGPYSTLDGYTARRQRRAKAVGSA